MKSVLVCGSNGQLGQEIEKLKDKYSNLKFLLTDVDQLNISKIEELEKFFESNQIDVIINCAAYTAVDNAEDEPELAEKINATATRNLAEIAKLNNVKFIHISTDYVFDGSATSPIKETYPTNPQSVYGATKLLGEKYFIESGVDGIIIRTSWLYSTFGKNFVKTILNLSKTRDELKVVNDQIGTPTNAQDLAKSILDICLFEGKPTANKIYHFSNEGVCSWYDFASEIVKYSLTECIVHPVGSEEFPTKAKRPAYSVLDKSLIKSDFNIEIPYWKESLHKCLDQLL